MPVRSIEKNFRAGLILASVLILGAGRVRSNIIGPGTPPGTVVVSPTSMVMLLALPSEFQGVRVQTLGYFVASPREQVIYLSRADAENAIFTNAIAVSSSSGAVALSGKYVLIEGKFNAGSYGHLGDLRAQISGAVLFATDATNARATVERTDRLVTVSLVELASHASEFAGRKVQIVGYARTWKNEVFVFWSKEAGDLGQPRTCVSFKVSENATFHKRFVLVIGEFSPLPPEKSFDCFGELLDVSGPAPFGPK